MVFGERHERPQLRATAQSAAPVSSGSGTGSTAPSHQRGPSAYQQLLALPHEERLRSKKAMSERVRFGAQWVQPDLVKNKKLPQARRAGRASLQVNCPCSGHVTCGETRIARTQIEVSLLRIKEERLIPWTACIPTVITDELHRSFSPICQLLSFILLGIADNLTEPRRSAGSACPQDSFSERSDNCRLTSHRLDQRGIRITQTGYGYSSSRFAQRPQKLGHTVRRESHIWVESQYGGSPSGDTNSSVDAGSVSRVPAQFDYDRRGCQLSRGRRAAVHRAVVGNKLNGQSQAAPSPAGQGREEMSREVTRCCRSQPPQQHVRCLVSSSVQSEAKRGWANASMTVVVESFSIAPCTSNSDHRLSLGEEITTRLTGPRRRRSIDTTGVLPGHDDARNEDRY